MSYTATRRLQFCAGHRVHRHESKCSNMHGHNYVLYIHARPLKGLDKIGRVIDFSVLKRLMGDWIEKHWDHGFIFYIEDKMLSTLFHPERKLPGIPHPQGFLNTHKHYGMTTNPTAENMAYYLLNTICPILFKDTNVEIFKVVLWETENCFAEVILDN